MWRTATGRMELETCSARYVHSTRISFVWVTREESQTAVRGAKTHTMPVCPSFSQNDLGTLLFRPSADVHSRRTTTKPIPSNPLVHSLNKTQKTVYGVAWRGESDFWVHRQTAKIVLTIRTMLRKYSMASNTSRPLFDDRIHR